MFAHQPPVPAVDAAAVPAEAMLVDVREPDEWAAGHAPGALHIPLGDLVHRAGEIPQDRQVHVVCKVGARSAHAVQALNANGWDAVNVDGGMLAWEAVGRPLISDSGAAPVVV
jgi:rhodanese-related sulfurtransferase